MCAGPALRSFYRLSSGLLRNEVNGDHCRLEPISKTLIRILCSDVFEGIKISPYFSRHSAQWAEHKEICSENPLCQLTCKRKNYTSARDNRRRNVLTLGVQYPAGLYKNLRGLSGSSFSTFAAWLEKQLGGRLVSSRHSGCSALPYIPPWALICSPISRSSLTTALFLPPQRPVARFHSGRLGR